MKTADAKFLLKLSKELTEQGTLLRSHIKEQKEWNKATDDLIDLPPVFEIEGVSDEVAEYIKGYLLGVCKRHKVKSLHFNYYQ